jgi:hypothetical protein
MTIPENQLTLLNKRVDRGITKTTASKLIKGYLPERITQKLELYDYLKSTNSPLLDRNPAGYLRKAIEEDYTPPEGFTTSAQREERKRKEQEEKQQQELLRKEREYQEWLNTPDEEKIKGDLWIWQHRFKKEYQRNPSQDEIEAKKHLLICKLPTPEEKTYSGEKCLQSKSQSNVLRVKNFYTKQANETGAH